MKYQVTPDIILDDSEFQVKVIQASGPGGQNVNKVATAVQLSFDVFNSPSLPDDVRTRLASLAGRRLTSDGRILIQARRYRTQEQNLQDAVSRLIELVRSASIKPKSRRKTRPTFASKQRRLEAKRHHGQLKRIRRSDENLE